MFIVIIFAQLVLVAVFGVAGVAKLLDPRGTQEAASNFGVPSGLAGPLSILLPIFELAIALALPFRVSTWWATLGALSLLCVFIVVMSFKLVSGHAPECHCFGQLYSRPLGWPALLRNVALAVLAGFVLWQEPRGGAQSMSMLLGDMYASHGSLTLGAFAAALVAIALSIVYFRKGKSPADSSEGTPDSSLTSVSRGLPFDSLAPEFELTPYRGNSGSLRKLLAHGKPVLLVFANPSCGPCVSIFREVGQWQRGHSAQMTIAIVSQGSIKDNFVNTVRNDLRNILLQEKKEVADLYEATVTPTAVIVRSDGRIGSHLAAGADEIRNLVHSILMGPDLGKA
jgi:thiol-disulfide isomerase/thioredoxin